MRRQVMPGRTPLNLTSGEFITLHSGSNWRMQSDTDGQRSAGQQMRAQADLRRPSNASIVTSSTTSTAISSRRNSPTDTVFSTSQDAGWGYNPKGVEYN